MVRPGKEKASVEALFDLDGEELVIRREISAETGRSRVFVNDSLSSQDAVAALRPRLVLNVSQHGRQKLLQPSWQAWLVDSFLPDRSLVRERDERLALARGAARKKLELERSAAETEQKRDLLEFQKAEIDKVAPTPGEEEELLERQRRLKDRAKTSESVERCLALLHGESGPGLLDMLRECSREIGRLSELDQDFSDDAAALDEFLELTADLDARLRRDAPDAEGPDMEKIEARLYEFSRLKRKLGRDMQGVMGLRAEIEENLSRADSLALDMKRLDEEEAEATSKLKQAVESLNAARREAAAALAERLASELRSLGFPKEARVEFDFEENEIHPGVFEDRPRVIWIPNPGQNPQPLDRIASGGELSRFLLAAVTLMAAEDMPTLIFDEVDAGVGGITLNRVGERVADLASKRQVLLITHWPQLAVLAGKHFHVSKEVSGDDTRVNCRPLSGREVREELSRMAGGGSRGEAMARELLSE
jgi:DNA repair protein RecN (Recombination protein N)